VLQQGVPILLFAVQLLVQLQADRLVKTANQHVVCSLTLMILDDTLDVLVTDAEMMRHDVLWVCC
jgi:hypothetical protein